MCVLGGMIYKGPDTHETVLPLLPWLLGLLTLGRLLVAGWLLRQIVRRNLVEARTVMRWLIALVLLGLALFGILAWAVPGELVPWYYIAFAVLLVMPMAHLAATPLALAWNRHR